MTYLPYIVRALEKFYTYDELLFDIAPWEGAFTFRLAKYLSEDLEGDGKDYVVDCEYDKMQKNGKTVQKESQSWTDLGNTNGIRHDIIFHKRTAPSSTQNENIFILEIKKESERRDTKKVSCEVRDLQYQEGFSIHHFKKQGVKITEYSATDATSITHSYKPTTNGGVCFLQDEQTT